MEQYKNYVVTALLSVLGTGSIWLITTVVNGRDTDSQHEIRLEDQRDMLDKHEDALKLADIRQRNLEGILTRVVAVQEQVVKMVDKLDEKEIKHR